MDQLTLWIGRIFWPVLLVGFSLLQLTLRLYRTNRFLKEALERERLSNTAAQKLLIGNCFRACNSMQRSLLEAFLREPTPSLQSLVERTEREFRARASEPPSAAMRELGWTDDKDETQELGTRDFILR